MLKVQYCANCGLPYEYCAYGSADAEKCKNDLQSKDPDLHDIIYGVSESSGIPPEGSRRRKRIVQAAVANSKGHIEISKAARGKKKAVCIIAGVSCLLKDDNDTLEDLSQNLRKKLACGCTVTDDGEIAVQGDVMDDIIDIMVNQYDVPRENIKIGKAGKVKSGPKKGGRGGRGRRQVPDHSGGRD